MKPANSWKSIVAGYNSLCYAASTLSLFPHIDTPKEQEKQPIARDSLMNCGLFSFSVGCGTIEEESERSQLKNGTIGHYHNRPTKTH